MKLLPLARDLAALGVALAYVGAGLALRRLRPDAAQQRAHDVAPLPMVRAEEVERARPRHRRYWLDVREVYEREPATPANCAAWVGVALRGEPIHLGEVRA